MTTLLIITFYVVAGLASLGLLGIMILYTIAEHDVRSKENAKRDAEHIGSKEFLVASRKGVGSC